MQKQKIDFYFTDFLLDEYAHLLNDTEIDEIEHKSHFLPPIKTVNNELRDESKDILLLYDDECHSENSYPINLNEILKSAGNLFSINLTKVRPKDWVNNDIIFGKLYKKILISTSSIPMQHIVVKHCLEYKIPFQFTKHLEFKTSWIFFDLQGDSH